MPKCTCPKPLPVSPQPPRINCLVCGGTVHYDRETALREAIARVDQTQADSIRAAGYAFFLEDLGYGFDEISEYLEQQEARKGVREC